MYTEMFAIIRRKGKGSRELKLQKNSAYCEYCEDKTIIELTAIDRWQTELIGRSLK
jgi:hypothetical protein